MSWQKCPICNGTGIEPLTGYIQCKTCKGERIISSVTGKPPVNIKDKGESGNINKVEDIDLIK